MKKILIIFFVCLFITDCGPLMYIKNISKPIMYDNVIISVVTDNVLLFPKITDKDFIPLLATHLKNETKREIIKQGSLKIISKCEPRTLKITQEITGVTVNTVTDVNTGFFVFQLLRGSVTSTKSDMICIDSIITISDCESGKILGTYNYQSSNQNPIDILKNIAFYDVYYVYYHQYDEIK